MQGKAARLKASTKLRGCLHGEVAFKFRFRTLFYQKALRVVLFVRSQFESLTSHPRHHSSTSSSFWDLRRRARLLNFSVSPKHFAAQIQLPAPWLEV